MDLVLARAIHAISTATVAILVMICVPVSQLRMELKKAACCCPDPSRCHCPDHKKPSGHTTMKACHEPPVVLAATPAPVLASPGVELAAPVRIAALVAAPPLASPHAPPPPRRPDAPS